VNTLDIHLAIPKTRNLIVYFSGFFILDSSTNGVVGSRKVPLGFEFDIRDKIVLGTSHEAMISKLILHLSEEDTPGVHVWLRQNADGVSPSVE
jgi:hypothetical protein